MVESAITGRSIGQYRIEAKLGEGGVGEVYLAVDTLLGRTVAIKRMRPELAAKSNIVERFRSEARTLAGLNHPNIATLYALERDGDSLLMVMEYVEGEDVSSLIRRRGALALDPALSMFFQALDGVGYVHSRGIVHRDIKGSNLMLSRSGLLKVMDFGIARVVGSERLTRVGQLVGTPEFMSPEQIRGEEPDIRSDIYSLGILLSLLLTARVPFDAKGEYGLMQAQLGSQPIPPSTLVAGLPQALDEVIGTALAKRASDRFESAELFRSALLPFADEIAGWPRESFSSPGLLELAASGESAADAPPSGERPRPAVGAEPESEVATRVRPGAGDEPRKASPGPFGPPRSTQVLLDAPGGEAEGTRSWQPASWLTAMPLEDGEGESDTAAVAGELEWGPGDAECARVASAVRLRRWIGRLGVIGAAAILLAGVDWLWLEGDIPERSTPAALEREQPRPPAAQEEVAPIAGSADSSVVAPASPEVSERASEGEIAGQKQQNGERSRAGRRVARAGDVKSEGIVERSKGGAGDRGEPGAQSGDRAGWVIRRR